METATITNIEIESHSITDRGLSEKRPENEDSFLESVSLGLFAVADGVGGAEAGEIASQMAVETLFQAFSNAQTDSDDITVMASAFEKANDAIFKMADELPQLSRMATTIVALKLSGRTATVGHVGDSRIYRFGQNGELQRLTDDHSLVGDEIRAGRLTEEEAENHPAKNVISRALGAEPSVEPEFAVVAVERGEMFLLCSDGITRHVSDAEIRGALATCESPEAACLYLKDVCFSRGAEDNLTAVIVRVRGRSSGSDANAFAASAFADEGDDEPTVSLSRPFGSDDDDLLELGERTASTETNPADDLELFETVKDIQIGYGESQIAAEIDDPDRSPIAQTIEITKSDNIAEPNEIEPAVPNIDPVDTSAQIGSLSDREVAAPTFGSAYADDRTSSSGGSYSTVLLALGCVVVGSLIGIAAYHYGFGGSAEPPLPPPQVEMQSENIPLSSFEKIRRTVDADPAAFLREFPPAKDAEDHVLIARACALTGDIPRAKASLAEALAKLATVAPVNQKTIKTEIAFLQTIVSDPNALKRFQAEMSKPAG